MQCRPAPEGTLETSDSTCCTPHVVLFLHQLSSVWSVFHAGLPITQLDRLVVASSGVHSPERRRCVSAAICSGGPRRVMMFGLSFRHYTRIAATVQPSPRAPCKTDKATLSSQGGLCRAIKPCAQSVPPRPAPFQSHTLLDLDLSVRK